MHTRIPDVVVISNMTLNKLNDEQTAAVYEAMAESIAFQKQAWNEAVAETRELAIDEFGVNFIDVKLAPFREAVEPMYEALKQYPEQYSLYREIRSTADETE